MELLHSPPMALIWGLSGLAVILLVAVTRLFVSHKKQTRYVSQNNQSLDCKSIDEGLQTLKDDIEQVKNSISNGRDVYNELTGFLDESKKAVAKIKAGLIPPVFNIHDSEKLKASVNRIRDKQFDCLSQNKATRADSKWSWFGSQSKGKQMVDGYRSLLLEAFNAEFEMIRKQMRAPTLSTAQDKLQRLFDQLEKLGETAHVSISDEYLALKNLELSVWHSELERLEKIKAERKLEKEILREQARLNAPDTEELDEEMAVCDSELLKAKAKAKELSGIERDQLSLEIQRIEELKATLEEKFERAISQAQITKAGYVYVISNIGSFGEGVVKIGMTRRLEPMDRVNELGDASVPFRFDVHTLAFCDDAPKVEKSLHDKFSEFRVNTDNHRKEFFRVHPLQVQEALDSMDIESDWYFNPEAKEYFESQVISNAQKPSVKTGSSTLPESI